MKVIDAVTKVGSEIRVRDFSEPLQDQRESASYASRFTFPLDFGPEYNYNNIMVYENQMIRIWRMMAKNPYIDFAIDDIVNEMISYSDEEKYPVNLDLNKTSFSKSIREKIHAEWTYLMKLLVFHKKAYSLLRDWYIDGKQYFYVEAEKDTICKITVLDPIRTKKVVDKDGNATYYYQDFEMTNTLFQFPEKYMIAINSGLMDDYHQIWISYLNKAYVPLNQLDGIETALLIYRIARAPERRVFYIDTGDLPKSKAETHLREVARCCQNRVEYDPKTGKIKESTLKMSLLDDIYLPRSSDGRGTQVEVLNGGADMFKNLEDLDYFKMKLFRSLNVPFSRWSEFNTPANVIGRTAEITRDELKYRKFINRLRVSYSALFTNLLRMQLSLKNIISENEFNLEYENIMFEWVSDSMFAEMRDLEILNERLNIIDRVAPNIGVLFSSGWVKRNVLKFTDKEIEDMDNEIKKEKESNTPAPNDDPTVDNDEYSEPENNINPEEEKEIELYE